MTVSKVYTLRRACKEVKGAVKIPPEHRTPGIGMEMANLCLAEDDVRGCEG